MKQGQYDGLCGVYSIVNAVGELTKTSEKDQDRRKALFDIVCGQLNEDRLLLSAVTGGISAGDYDVFIRRALEAIEAETGIGIDVATPFRGGQFATDAFYDGLVAHIGTQGRSLVVLWVSGGWDHWTVVRSISEARVNLIDSDGRDHLPRKSCSVYPDTGGDYVLRPRQSYVLTLRQAGAEPIR
jgi:hypothetical protein